MRIKEVQAGVKIVKNYNSYQMNLTAELENGDIVDEAGEKLIERAKKIIEETIDSVSENLVEVGAAWPHKKSSNFLSVQFSKGGNYEDIRISDLKETREGYEQESPEGVLIYKKINEKRSNKMPLFRVYKEVKK